MSGRPLYLGDNIFQRTEERLIWLRQDLRGTISIAREYGFTGVYFYGQDEASREVMREQIPTWQVAHEVGAKVQVAVTQGELNYVPDELDLLIAVPPVSRERAAARHRLGHKVHCYGFPMSSTTDPLQWRRNYGLYVWSRDYDGVTPYCFMHNGEGVWNDLDDIDHNIAYPTVNGAISTLALEALREGADDVHYATFLMKTIKEARRSRGSEAMVSGEKANEWIDFFKLVAKLIYTFRDKSKMEDEKALIIYNPKEANVLGIQIGRLSPLYRYILEIDGIQRPFNEVYRKIQPQKIKALQAEEAWVAHAKN